jgi:hypothetical protein
VEKSKKKSWRRLNKKLQQLRKTLSDCLSDEAKEGILIEKQKKQLRAQAGGRKRSAHLMATLGRSNRKVPGLSPATKLLGHSASRLELSAATKLKICQELQLQQAAYATPESFWSSAGLQLAKAAKAAAKGKQKPAQSPAVPPPLPPPDLPPPQQGPLCQLRLRIVSEAAGSAKFGMEGLCSSHDSGTDSVRLDTVLLAIVTVAAQYTVQVPESGFAKPSPWKTLNCLSRPDKQYFLVRTRLWPETPEDQEDQDNELEVTSATTQAILDQTLFLGWQLLKWSLKQHNVSLKAIRFLDPILSTGWLLMPEGHNQLEQRGNMIKSHLVGAAKLLCPIWAPQPDHWTLLVLYLEPASPEPQLLQVKYYDTLGQPSENNKAAAQKLLALLFAEAELPERGNSVRQPISQALCGWLVLAYIEHEVAEAVGCGLASKPWPLELVHQWRLRMTTFTSGLQKERKKLGEETKEAEKKKAAKASLAAKAAAKAKASQHKTQLSASLEQDLAQKSSNSGHFGLENLSDDIKAELARIELHCCGVCSKCRRTSGCHRCDLIKARRYYLRKGIEEKPKSGEEKPKSSSA